MDRRLRSGGVPVTRSTYSGAVRVPSTRERRVASTQACSRMTAAVGEPAPEPGQQAELLRDAFESGDPIELVGRRATAAAEALDADDPW